MQNLHNTWIRKDLIQQVHLSEYLKGVYEEVLLPRRNLNQANKAAVRPEVVMLNVDSDLLAQACGLDFLNHLSKVTLRPHDYEGRVLHAVVPLSLARREKTVWPGQVCKLFFVRMWKHHILWPAPDPHGLEVRPQRIWHRATLRVGWPARPEAHLALRRHKSCMKRRALIVLHDDPWDELRPVIIHQLTPTDLWLRGRSG
mmetsp:Transcript_33694/g.60497  ORF Transcript_33694/g.60497 Transcript_33694/m.60497 type:complete len:200 (-) Transcript_33694:480-1079(-)